MEKAKLQAVAKELNDLLGLDPAINPEAAEAEVEGKIKEAVLLIEKGDKVSSDSVTALVELGFTEHLTACGLIKAKKEKKAKAKAEKVAGAPSNKSVIFLAWKSGKTDVKELLALVKDAVKESTVKGWLNQWKHDKNLPAVAK